MRVKLTATGYSEELGIIYVELQNITDMCVVDGKTTILAEAYNNLLEVKETPEEIENLERQAILARNLYIQENKEKHWTESLHENVKKSNTEVLDQVKMLIKSMENKIKKQGEEIKALKKQIK